MTEQHVAAGKDRVADWFKALALLALTAMMLLLSPLLGAYLAGHPLQQYLVFPPHPEFVAQAEFSWPVFIVLAVFIVGAVLPFIILCFRTSVTKPDNPHPSGALPWWGWLGLAIAAFGWWLAWGRSSVVLDWHGHSFSLLWLGYILLINGMSFRRNGRCLMLMKPVQFLLLFPVSGIFWWFFEYLNLFVNNWYYRDVGVPVTSGALLAPTLAFATVLPAVASTTHWLGTFSRFDYSFFHGWPIRIMHARAWSFMVLVATLLSLVGLGGWPQYVYPLVWVSPLLILLSILTLTGRNTVFSSLATGDWRPVALPALAGLICGFFWELWNYGSLLHWEYNIPYVNRFHLFEMPVLGYAGYLPFGLECILIVSLLWGSEHRLFQPPIGS